MICVGYHPAFFFLPDSCEIYIDTSRQHQYIRNGLYQMIFFLHNSATVIFHRQTVNNHQTDNCCRKCNEKVFLKFICHLTTLSITCGNCRIRDKGQIIPKHCTTHDCRNTKRQVKPRCSRHGYSNRGN